MMPTHEEMQTGHGKAVDPKDIDAIRREAMWEMKKAVIILIDKSYFGKSYIAKSYFEKPYRDVANLIAGMPLPLDKEGE